MIRCVRCVQVLITGVCSYWGHQYQPIYLYIYMYIYINIYIKVDVRYPMSNIGRIPRTCLCACKPLLAHATDSILFGAWRKCKYRLSSAHIGSSLSDLSFSMAVRGLRILSLSTHGVCFDDTGFSMSTAPKSFAFGNREHLGRCDRRWLRDLSVDALDYIEACSARRCP